MCANSRAGGLARPVRAHPRVREALADEGTTIVKVFLHVSRDEQRERLQERLDDPGEALEVPRGRPRRPRTLERVQRAYEDVLARRPRSGRLVRRTPDRRTGRGISQSRRSSSRRSNGSTRSSPSPRPGSRKRRSAERAGAQHVVENRATSSPRAASRTSRWCSGVGSCPRPRGRRLRRARRPRARRPPRRPCARRRPQRAARGLRPLRALSGRARRSSARAPVRSAKPSRGAPGPRGLHSQHDVAVIVTQLDDSRRVADRALVRLPRATGSRTTPRRVAHGSVARPRRSPTQASEHVRSRHPERSRPHRTGSERANLVAERDEPRGFVQDRGQEGCLQPRELRRSAALPRTPRRSPVTRLRRRRLPRASRSSAHCRRHSIDMEQDFACTAPRRDTHAHSSIAARGGGYHHTPRTSTSSASIAATTALIQVRPRARR